MYIPFGYRKFCHWTNGTGNQESVKTREEIYGLVDQYLGIENIGLSICTYDDTGIPHLLFLPFDFDSELALKLAWNDAIILYNHFVDLKLDVHLTYSGKKGFHVLVGVVPKPYQKEKIRAFQKWFIKKFDLKTADPQLIGDIKRIIRLPYTYNIKGNLCKELAYSEGELLDLDDLLLTAYIPKPTTYKKKELHDMPCIEDLVRHDPEPRELIRLSYVALRLDKGISEDDIVDEIKTFDWVDMDEELCRRKIQYINDGNYLPLGCNSIQDMELCLKDECPYYRKIDKKDLDDLGIKYGNKPSVKKIS
jgi:hypothetical protein